MLSYDELLNQVKQLSQTEKLALLEDLAHFLREDLKKPGRQKNQRNNRSGRAEKSSLERVYGLLKTEEPTPTDDQLTEDYTNYLIEKYS